MCVILDFKRLILLAMFILCLSGVAGAQAQPRIEYATVYGEGYIARYEQGQIPRLYPPPDFTGSNGIALLLPSEEEISFYREAINYIDASDRNADPIREENDENSELFFANKVKNCQEVTVGGFFKVYYACENAWLAGARHPETGASLYVSYSFNGKPLHAPLFLQILRSYAITTENIDYLTAKPAAFHEGGAYTRPEVKNIFLRCADLQSFEVRRLVPDKNWSNQADRGYFYPAALFSPEGSLKFQRLLAESEGSPRDFRLQDEKLYTIYAQEFAKDVRLPYDATQISLPENYRDPRQAAELARGICPDVPITMPDAEL